MVQKLMRHTGKTILGLTGSFGSGKSTVAHLFEELGAYRIDADALAHEALLKDSPPYAQIAGLFEEAVDPKTGNMDRKIIAGIIFKDTARRRQLEQIVHPYVFQRITDEIAEAEEKVIVVEVPLLFETGFDQFCDSVVVVTASNESIEARLKEKGFTPAQIQSRRQAQLSIEEKKKRASRVINNSGNLEETRREVDQIWKDFHPDPKGEK